MVKYGNNNILLNYSGKFKFLFFFETEIRILSNFFQKIKSFCDIVPERLVYGLEEKQHTIILL